jgi:hypothetical protein
VSLSIPHLTSGVFPSDYSDNAFSNLIFAELQFQVFIAVLVDNLLYPISAFRSHFAQSINWSGIRYYLRNGKISKVHGTCCVLERSLNKITLMV